MNKITLDLFLAKSKTTIKGLFVLVAFLLMNTQTSWGQLLQWNTLGNTGTETTEASIANATNIAAANLTQSGITGGSNSNRFGGSGWFDAGNTVTGNTLAQAIAGNNYIQFVVTPASGYSFTPTSFVFKWDRSSTGPTAVTLRSSADNYAADLGSVTGMVSGGQATNTDRTITITGLTNITTATTFRIYAYGATATTGTGGFDCATGSTVNVALNGTVASSVVSAPVINNASFTASTTVLAANANIFTVTATNTPTNFSATGLPTGLSINPTTGVISGTPATGTAALSPYTVVLQASNSGGDSATENLTLTINKANQTITFTPTLITKAIGDTPVTLTASSTSGLAVSYGTSDSGVASLSGSTLSFVSAGTATITASQAGDVDYNAATSVTQDQVVSAAPLSDQTITFGTLTPVTYGDTTFDLTATASSSLAVSYTSSNTAVATVSGSTVTILSAGSTDITASQGGNGSFNPAANVMQTLTVNAKALTITDAAAASRAYNGLLTTTITGTLTGIIGLDDVTFDGTLKGTFADANVADGIAVTSNCTLAGTKAGNYTLTQPTGLTANITQATQTITFTALTNKVVGDPTFELTGTASSGLTVTYTSSNTAVATVSGTTVTIVGAGSTDITASQAGNGNYAAATDVVRTLTVTGLNFAVGDISIIALANDAPDGISFVNWVPIPVDAELNFTDNAYDAGALKTSEGGSLVWKNTTGSIIPVGTVIYISTLTTASTDLGSVTGALDGLSASGENLFVYEGSSASPNLIYGLSNLPWITTGSATSNNSYLPAVLNVTNGNIVTGDSDNVEYSGALALKDEKSSFAAYKTLVNNPANWTKSNTYFALNSIDFELAAVWEGATWTDAVVPSSGVKTIINDTYNTTTHGSFSAKSVRVNTDKTLTIASGTSVTVENALVNNGTITVENNANLRQTALANTNSGSGTATVKRNSAALKRLDYTMWSSPVSGTQTLEGFSQNTSRNPNQFWTYDAATNKFVNVPTTSTFTAGLGYLIRMPNDATTTPTAFEGQFTGIPNNGTITLSSLAPNKFYSVGNPYPSTLDANAFLNGNSTGGTLYFWRKTNGVAGSAYATRNLLGGSASGAGSEDPNGTIQVGQGFIVKTGAAANQLVFTNAMRLGTTSTQFFKTRKETEKSRLWLNLTNTAGLFSQALVGYLDGATLGVDNGYDGLYINDSATALTSIVDGEEYTIQGRPAFDVTDVVALGFKTGTAGDFTIAINKKDGALATQDIYLVDSKTGIETDLNAGSYTFAAEAGVDNSRFSLKYQKTLKVGETTFDENTVKVYKNNGTIYVNAADKSIKTIEVYDVQGRLVAKQTNVKSNTATISNLKAVRQMLIVKVSADDNSVVSKKVMN